MELKWFAVVGDIDNLDKIIFDTVKDSETFLNKKIKIERRIIFPDKTGFLHAIVKVACK